MHLSKKSFFLISFLPAMAYWYLEENYPIRIAIAGGLILSILEITFEKIYTKKVHTLSLFNFYLILFLGSLSLIGDEGIWFKLQPMFTGVGISLFLLYKLKKVDGLLIEMLESFPSKNQVPHELMKYMEGHVAIFFLIYGIFMGAVAFWGSTDQWLFFKTLGFYGVFLIFMVFEFFMMRKKMLQIHKRQFSSEVLGRFNPRL